MFSLQVEIVFAIFSHFSRFKTFYVFTCAAVIKKELFFCLSMKRQPPEMVKHLKMFSAIADELFECVWPFCGVGA